MAMVLQANKESSELGGHIASYQSAATLYEVGFNHFWHAPSDGARRRPRLHPGPLVARHLRARVPRGPPHRGAAAQLPPGGRRRTALSSYPHPWLMPEFWQFPTVSMGLGPLMAIYQARFMKYLQGRGIADTARPQGVGVHGRRRDGRARVAGRDLAGRPRAASTTSIFVVNCNLQRLDGPVRGNGKIIQELETNFRGAGWNVIKVDLGLALGPAARRRPRRACSCGGWRRPSTATTRPTSRATAPSCASTSSAYPELREMVARHVRRGGLGAQPRRPRPREGLRRLRRRQPRTPASRR